MGRYHGRRRLTAKCQQWSRSELPWCQDACHSIYLEKIGARPSSGTDQGQLRPQGLPREVLYLTWMEVRHGTMHPSQVGAALPGNSPHHSGITLPRGGGRGVGTPTMEEAASITHSMAQWGRGGMHLLAKGGFPPQLSVPSSSAGRCILKVKI